MLNYGFKNNLIFRPEYGFSNFHPLALTLKIY